MLAESLKLIYFLFPVYIADIMPLLFRNKLKSLEFPLDLGIKLEGNSLFGAHKTFRGILVAILFGTIMFYFQKVININSIIIYRDYSVLLGFFLAIGAMFGDLFKSFIKRRINIIPGHNFFIADQIDAVLGAILFSSLIIKFTYLQIVLMVVFTYFLKLLLSYVGFVLHIRKHKW